MIKVKVPKLYSLAIRGIPPEVWTKAIKEVEAWKKADFDSYPTLRPRTGQLRDSITGRQMTNRKSGKSRWVAGPMKTRKDEWYASRKSVKAKRRRKRNRDILYWQIRAQQKQFMALTRAQKDRLFALLRDLLKADAARGRVRLDLKQGS